MQRSGIAATNQRSDILSQQPSEEPLYLPEESTSTPESEENVKNIHNDLLPHGCLSPLPSTPPRPPPSKKPKKLKVSNVTSDLPKLPTSVTASSAMVP